MKPAVSIIVPVYNGEKTLERCVDSVLKQEYKDFELFLINDGSSDKTREICERYAAADDRVLVIHKENSGVSESRNMAIAQAHGEYLQFLDCDDWITPDATKLLVRAAKEEQADLVIADFYRVIGERLSHKGDIEIDGVMDQEAFVGCMMEKPADFYYGVLWNKLYRSAFSFLISSPSVLFCSGAACLISAESSPIRRFISLMRTAPAALNSASAFLRSASAAANSRS